MPIAEPVVNVTCSNCQTKNSWRLGTDLACSKCGKELRQGPHYANPTLATAGPRIQSR